MLYSETVFLATPSQPGASVQRANVRPLRSLRAQPRIQATHLTRHSLGEGGSNRLISSTCPPKPWRRWIVSLWHRHLSILVNPLVNSCGLLPRNQRAAFVRPRIYALEVASKSFNSHCKQGVSPENTHFICCAMKSWTPCNIAATCSLVNSSILPCAAELRIAFQVSN